MRFSEYFSLGVSQHELDFVDIPIDTDIRLFLDPYAISIPDDPWFVECNNIIVGYFDLVIEAIRARDETTSLRLLSRLREPNQTHFGFSQGFPSGRSIGDKQSVQLHDRLRRSRAVRTGFLRDLADCELVIPGIARDKISDITTNIIKAKLIEYTRDQCLAHRVPLREVPQIYWHPPSQSWQSSYVFLPTVKILNVDQPVILVPKIIARLDLAYDAYHYYREYVLTYLQAEHLEAASSLVTLLKNGKKVVFKKDLKQTYPYSKDFLYQFSDEHPDVLDKYKSSVAPTEPLSNSDIEDTQRDPRDISYDHLFNLLAQLLPGSQAAAEYHDKVFGILHAIFYPQLWKFRKEREINQGRKRLDIVCENHATTGFFFRLNTFHRVLCPYIHFECKNYASDLANPEFDQLNGRLSDHRGRFGILICRSIKDKNKAVATCKDFLHNQSSYIIILDDDDLRALLHLKQTHDENGISDYLEDCLQKILF